MGRGRLSRGSGGRTAADHRRPGHAKLPHTAAEDLLEVITCRYERASTLLTSNRPVDHWGKLLGDTAAVTALLDRLLHHAHVLKCGPRSWRTKVQTDLHTEPVTK
jgi:DNA replication protein DnaC